MMASAEERESFQIQAGEIHLWFSRDADITDTRLIDAYRHLLNPDEAYQQQRFYFAKHRHQYLVTRALIRTVLSLHAGQAIAAADWAFESNEYGKPAVSNSKFETLKFNVSHTENMIVLAVTRDLEVGVDVEWAQRGGETIKIADRFFSPREVDELKALPVDRQRERFFDLWTLKESYIKACGMGLSIPLDQFSFSFPSNRQVSVAFAPQRNDHPSAWRFWQLCPGPGHKVAVAVRDAELNRSWHLVAREVVPMLTPNRVDFPTIRQKTGHLY